MDHCHLDTWDRAEETASSPGARQGFQHVLSTKPSASPGTFLWSQKKMMGMVIKVSTHPHSEHRSILWTACWTEKGTGHYQNSMTLAVILHLWQARCKHQTLQYYAHILVYIISVAIKAVAGIFRSWLVHSFVTHLMTFGQRVHGTMTGMGLNCGGLKPLRWP